MMYKKFTGPCLVVVVLLCAASSVRAVEAIQLVAGEESYDLSGKMEILEDSTGRAAVDQIASDRLADRWQVLPAQPGDLGRTQSAFWIRFHVDGRRADKRIQGWVLSLKTMALQSVRLYWEEAGVWQHVAGGYDEINSIPTPIRLQLPTPADGARAFYLRVTCETRIFFKLRIESSRLAIKKAKWRLFLYGSFNGLMFLIMLLNLALFIALKDRSYIWCVGFQLSITVYAYGQNGLFDDCFSPPALVSWIRFHSVLIAGVAFFAAGFTRSFLKTARHTRRMDKFLVFCMAGCVVLLCLVPFAHWEILMWYTVVLGLLAPVTSIVPGIQGIRRGFRPARLYLAAWGSFGLFAFLVAGPFSWEWIESYAFQIGGAVNAVLLTLALVDRLSILRQEQKIAAAALAGSERKFRTLANATHANIVIVQEDKFVYANKGFLELINEDLESLKKKTLDEVLPKEALEKARRGIEEAHAQGKSNFRYEVNDPRNGRWYEVSAGLVDIDGKPSIISTSLDITDRKQSDEQMFRAEKMAALGQIIAGVAHEINNPNNFIYFNLPILKKYIEHMKPMLDTHFEQDPDLKILNMPYEFFIEDIHKLLDNMTHGSKRITDIVADLKNYVRSSGTEDKQPEAIDGVIKQVMTLVGKQVRKSVKRLDVEIADSLPMVRMHVGKIEQVLINLVINAGQAADKKDSWVKLVARRSDEPEDMVEIVVEDNGAGIPEEIRQKIFEPFFTTKGSESGTGLGLAISYQIIEDHGGSIDVWSEPGEGTRFTLRLPMYWGE